MLSIHQAVLTHICPLLARFITNDGVTPIVAMDLTPCSLVTPADEWDLAMTLAPKSMEAFPMPVETATGFYLKFIQSWILSRSCTFPHVLIYLDRLQGNCQSFHS